MLDSLPLQMNRNNTIAVSNANRMRRSTTFYQLGANRLSLQKLMSKSSETQTSISNNAKSAKQKAPLDIRIETLKQELMQLTPKEIQAENQRKLNLFANHRRLTKIAEGIHNFFEEDFGRVDSWEASFRKLSVFKTKSFMGSGGAKSNYPEDMELLESKNNSDSNSSGMIELQMRPAGIEEEDS